MINIYPWNSNKSENCKGLGIPQCEAVSGAIDLIGRMKGKMDSINKKK